MQYFRLEIIKNYIVYCAVPELNTDALICLAVKWVGRVGRYVLVRWVGWVGLGL